ncbi:hypothetical protein INR49_015677, partial [Caranx melampygus]
MVTRTKKIFVGGLSANTVVEDVKQYFEQFGKGKRGGICYGERLTALMHISLTATLPAITIRKEHMPELGTTSEELLHSRSHFFVAYSSTLHLSPASQMRQSYQHCLASLYIQGLFTGGCCYFCLAIKLSWFSCSTGLEPDPVGGAEWEEEVELNQFAATGLRKDKATYCSVTRSTGSYSSCHECLPHIRIDFLKSPGIL